MTNLVKGKYGVRREEVARLMKEQGWTVPRLAHAAKISENSIKRLFSGKDLRMTTIAPLAEKLETTPLALIDDSDSQARTQVSAVGVSDDGLLSPPTTDNQVGLPADAPPEKKEKVCFRFSFEIDVPYASFREKEQVPVLLAEIGKQIHQMGALVIASAQPGSVRINCWATEKGDVDRFFSAFAEGKLASLGIMNPQLLDDLVEDEDDASDDREPTTPSDSPTPSSSTNTGEQTKFKALDSSGGYRSSSSVITEHSSRIGTIAAGAVAGAMIGGAILPGAGTVIGGILGVYAGMSVKYPQDKPESTPDDKPY